MLSFCCFYHSVKDSSFVSARKYNKLILEGIAFDRNIVQQNMILIFFLLFFSYSRHRQRGSIAGRTSACTKNRPDQIGWLQNRPTRSSLKDQLSHRSGLWELRNISSIQTRTLNGLLKVFTWRIHHFNLFRESFLKFTQMNRLLSKLVKDRLSVFCIPFATLHQRETTTTAAGKAFLFLKNYIFANWTSICFPIRCTVA